jgi:hypothetical protein
VNCAENSPRIYQLLEVAGSVTSIIWSAEISAKVETSPEGQRTSTDRTCYAAGILGIARRDGMVEKRLVTNGISKEKGSSQWYRLYLFYGLVTKNLAEEKLEKYV